MDSKLIKLALEENKEGLVNAINESIIEGVKRDLQWSLPEEVKGMVNDFLKTEVLPEVKAKLFDSKEDIVNHATEIAVNISTEVGNAIQREAVKNLSQSWNVKKILEAIT